MNENKEWIHFLYFAYKKAKHFVTRETSFIEEIEILEFEKDINSNIEELENILNKPTEIEKFLKEMNGHLYFVPKSFGPNREPRIRPKVSFPFKYQILWAAVILRIGEWFDTNKRMKNVYSLRNHSIRNELEWMVPWSFNGRLKRLVDKNSDNIQDSSFIHFNDNRLYESHQMALKKFHLYEQNETKKFLKCNEVVFKANLDIKEFFPTLEKSKIKKAIFERLNELKEISNFSKKYFDIELIKKIIDKLLSLKINFPDSSEMDEPLNNLLKQYYSDLTLRNENQQKYTIENLVEFLNNTLPLDLIASNFLSNCTLNYYIDREIYMKQLDDDDFSILRYTDDYLIIASNKEKLIEVIELIKNKLSEINLVYSPAKTLPTRVVDVYERIKQISINQNWDEDIFKEVVEKLKIDNIDSKKRIQDLDTYERFTNYAMIIGLDIEPQKVTKACNQSNTIISKLSNTSDIKLQSLTNNELEMYIRELMFYMQINHDLGELKEETAKIFASWRINASLNEKSFREEYRVNDIKEFLCMLEEAIKKYPYKMGFYDVYLLVLLRIIEQSNTGYSQLKFFFKQVRSFLYPDDSIQTKNRESRVGSIYFPSIRMRILNLMSNQWYRFSEVQRKKIRAIIEKTFDDWYANPKVYWEELYTLQRTLFIIRLPLPLNISDKNEVEFRNNHLINLKKLSKVYCNYFFVINDGDININTEDDIYIAIDLLKKGLYWNSKTNEYSFNEVENLIFLRIKKAIIKNPKLQIWLTFIKLAPEKVEKNFWGEGLKTSEENTDLDDEIFYETFDFLQYMISKYFKEPLKYKDFLEWCKSTKENENENYFIKYVQDRFEAYANIRSYFSLRDERLPVINLQSPLDNYSISIADWIFYCQTLPYNLESIPMKQKVLHPLTEYEFVYLLKIIIEKDKVKNYLPDNDFRNIVFDYNMTPRQWEDFRLGLYEQRQEKPGSPGSPRSTEEYVKALFTMLTNRPWHTHTNKTFSMYKWNDLQSYFEMTYYPSTSVASLFVNYLNIHQQFYSMTYQLPLVELPYREVYTMEKSKGNIEKWVVNYLSYQKDKQVYKTDNRKLELLEIDVDQLRR